MIRVLVMFLVFHFLGTGVQGEGRAARCNTAGEPKFNHGDVFITLGQHEGCSFGVEEMIWRVNPETGEHSVFATSADGLCDASGLRFSPDGTRLWVTNFFNFNGSQGGSVMAFGPDGVGELIYDATQGIAFPFGANSLAFDASGDLYVVRTAFSDILRLPVNGDSPSIFADFDDGIRDRGSLDFAPNGDLFYAGDLADAVIRIAPDGESSVFEALTNPYSLVFDKWGNLYLTAGGGNLFRYHKADPAQRSVLASGFFMPVGTPTPITFGPKLKTLYVAERAGSLYSVNTDTGETIPIISLTDSGYPGPAPFGIAVYDPKITGDLDGSGSVDIFDIFCVLDCFQRVYDNCSFSVCDIAPEGGNGSVNIFDIFAVLDAFVGQ